MKRTLITNHFCKCSNPKPEKFTDDLGRSVTYCHRCHNPILEAKDTKVGGEQ